jgi:hypothetical protein
MSEFPDGGAHFTYRRKRSEVERAIGNGACDRQNPERDFPSDFHEGIHPFPFVLNVEPGLPTLNKFHLLDQRRKLVLDVFLPDSAGFPDQLSHLLPRRSPEIGEEPWTHADRLSHIQRVAASDRRPGGFRYESARILGGRGWARALEKSSWEWREVVYFYFRFSFGKYRTCRRKEPLPRPVGFR